MPRSPEFDMWWKTQNQADVLEESLFSLGYCKCRGELGYIFVERGMVARCPLQPRQEVLDALGCRFPQCKRVVWESGYIKVEL